MKIKTLIASFGIALLAQSISAQEYLNLKQDGVIYDVDVVVFARNLAQPDAESIKQAASVKTENVLNLMPWDGETELMKYPQISQPQNGQDDEWQVPIEERAAPVRVLSWLILSNSLNHPIINRLNANPTFKTIYRQKWRQPATSFSNPKYVEVSNLPSNSVDHLGSDFNNNGFGTVNLHDDFSIDGQVAFSKQRFTHLHVKMNLFRQNQNNEQISYEISQKKRIELGQWQYFDHQQFGILAKVTAVSLKPGSE